MALDRLTRALKFALNVHKDQVDKSGQPYMLHICRVVEALRPHGREVQIVGALHDTLEDSESPQGTADAIKDYFGKVTLEAVEAVTRRKGETYQQFIERAARHHVGRLVKRADVVDHLKDPSALSESMVKRYQKARVALMG